MRVGKRGQFDVLVGGEVVATAPRTGLLARLLGMGGAPFDEEEAVAAVRARVASSPV